MMVKSYLQLMTAMTQRAGVLANMKMDTLRSTNGYGCETDWQAQQKDQGKSRGEVIEEILATEFDLEFDVDFEEEIFCGYNPDPRKKAAND